MLDKYKFNGYQMVSNYNVDGVEEIIVWGHTNDEDYLHNIFLTEGKITSLNVGDYYFSNDGTKEGLIFNPIRTENYKLYYLSDFSSKYKNLFTPYVLVTYEVDAEITFNNFVAEFTAMYPELSISSMEMDVHSYSITRR